MTVRCSLIVVQRALRIRNRCALFTPDRGRITNTYGYVDLKDLRLNVRVRQASRKDAIRPAQS